MKAGILRPDRLKSRYAEDACRLELAAPRQAGEAKGRGQGRERVLSGT